MPIRRSRQPPEELQVVIDDVHRKVDRTVTNRDSLADRECQFAGRVVTRNRENDQATAEFLVGRNAERVELVAIVIMGDAGNLLIGFGRKIEPRFDAKSMMLLPTGNQRLLEPRTDAFAAKQTQMPCPLREAEDAVRLGRTQPLKLRRQPGSVESPQDLVRFGLLYRPFNAGTSTAGTTPPCSR